MANCFRKISELDDAARNSSARESSDGKAVNESPVHSTVNIGQLQACCNMNIENSLDCLFYFFACFH